MRVRAHVSWLLLVLLLPALFYASALSGSCEYLTGEKNSGGKTKPAPPPSSDAAAGQQSAKDTLRQSLQTDSANTSATAGVLPSLSAGLLAAEKSGAAKLIAADVLEFGVLADGRVLCRDIYGRLFTVGQDGTGQQLWHSGWIAVNAGWSEIADNTYDIESNGLAVSADGKWVALSHLVSAEASGQDYPARCNAVILCSAAGGDGRLVALAEETDGGPQLDFTRDGKRLCTALFIPGEPTAAHYASLVSSSDEKVWTQDRYNTVAVPDGARSLQPGYDDAEYYERCAMGDNFAWQELDAPTWHFASFAGGGELGKFTPSEADGWAVYNEWVMPDAMLISFAGKQQRLIKVDGHSTLLPAGQYWRCFAGFSDGACLFSRDGGTSIEYGKVDWTSGSVDWSVARPDLAGFAEPLEDDSELPTVQHNWQALPDDSGALVRDPLYSALYLIKVSKEGAKP